MLVNTYTITGFYYILNVKNNKYPGIKNEEISQRWTFLRTLSKRGHKLLSHSIPSVSLQLPNIHS